jgi:hypothetical protein
MIKFAAFSITPLDTTTFYSITLNLNQLNKLYVVNIFIYRP